MANDFYLGLRSRCLIVSWILSMDLRVVIDLLYLICQVGVAPWVDLYLHFWSFYGFQPNFINLSIYFELTWYAELTKYRPSILISSLSII